MIENKKVRITLTEDELDDLAVATLNRASEWLSKGVAILLGDVPGTMEEHDTYMRLHKQASALYDKLDKRRRPMAERIS